MKVVCIDDNDGYNYLTIGKTYDVINEDGGEYDYGYYIIDDNNIKDWYGEYMFKPISEIRNDKINKLLE